MNPENPDLEARVEALESQMADLWGRTTANHKMLVAVATVLSEHTAQLRSIEATLADHTQRFELINTRFNAVHLKLDAVDQRLDKMDRKLDVLIANMTGTNGHTANPED